MWEEAKIVSRVKRRGCAREQWLAHVSYINGCMASQHRPMIRENSSSASSGLQQAGVTRRAAGACKLVCLQRRGKQRSCDQGGCSVNVHTCVSTFVTCEVYDFCLDSW